MSALVHLPAFVAAAAAVIVVPGPATLLVAARSATSRRAGAVATAGIVAGDLVAITAAGAGLGALVLHAPGIVHALRLVGAAWVAWLGLGMLRASAPEPVPSSVPDVVPHAGRGFAQALGMTLANPKPMLFFAAFLPLFVAPGERATLLAFWQLGALFEAINLAWFAAVILLAGAAGRGSARGPALHRLGGLALMGCAALVAFA